MPKGEGYGSFEDTFGGQNDGQPYDSSSNMNKADMERAAKANASYLRSTKLGNAIKGGRPFGKQVYMPYGKGYGKKAMRGKPANSAKRGKPKMAKPMKKKKR